MPVGLIIGIPVVFQLLRLLLRIASLGLQASTGRVQGMTSCDPFSPLVQLVATTIFYAPQLVPAGTAEARISYGNSVCPSVTTWWYTKPR